MTDEEIIDVARQVTQTLVQASFAAARSCVPKPKGIPEMLGEYLRDASVLIIIFVPIEIVVPRYIDGKPINMLVVKWTTWTSLFTLIAGIMLEKVGALLERRSR